jgi:tetratricopeptide (TPR) repeat protein
MKFKRMFLLGAIAAVGIVNILIYWNVHLCYRAKEKTEDPEKKIRILKGANLFNPANDNVFYEMGKSYFDLGMENLDDKTISQEYLQKSVQHFTRSLKINPASYFCHFNLAQSLLYLSYVSSDFDGNPYEEYKKAALLAGHNSQIYFEVGKIFLSLWPKLTVENRDFTQQTLKRILERKDPQMSQAVMHIWEMNVRDYKVMEEMLPEDAPIYRMYAKFLGEKSLSRDERQRYLAKAELLEFERAKDEYLSGEGEFQYYRTREAFRNFLSSLRELEKINLYQNLMGQGWISEKEVFELKKSVYLNMAKCLLEEGRDFDQAEGYLHSYLAMEDEVASVGELESFLRLRGYVKEGLGSSFDDLGRLSFQILLSFKQNRYRDIMKVGRLLEQSFVLVPEDKKEVYVRMLQLVGDSYQKVDYLYDAGELFLKALEIDPGNLETLLRIRQNYERLNEEEKIRKIDEQIERRQTPRTVDFKEPEIKRGKRAAYTLVLDGSEIILDLSINWEKEISPAPLIAVFVNGRVVWEEYLRPDEGKGQDENFVLSLPLKSKAGENDLVVVPLNRSVELLRIAYRRVNS